MLDKFWKKSAVFVGMVFCLFLATGVRAETVSLATESGKVELTFLEKGVVKVELIAPGIDSGFETGLTVPGILNPVAARNDTLSREINSLGLKVKYSLDPLRLSFVNASGQELLEMDQVITAKNGGSYSISFKKEPGDKYFGLGEPFPGYGGNRLALTPLQLDRNGKKQMIWNDHLPPSELGLPFFFSPRGYGLLIDNAFKAEFDFSRSNSFSYTAGGGPLRFYVFTDPSMYKILDAYSQLTGRPPMPPAWVTGYMQSRYGYKGEKDFRWLMDNFRSRNLPCDVLIFDLEWYFAGGKSKDLNMGELAWSTARFKDPIAFQKEMQDRGFKTVVIIQPYFTSTSGNFEAAKPFATKNQQGQPYVFYGLWGNIPESVLIDFTSPEAQKWYAQKVFDLHATGVDGWWTDLNEPETDREGMVFAGGKNRNASHNLMALSSHKAIYEMYRAQIPDERVFIISRSGFVGDWRYGAGIWSGDITAAWNHLTRNVQMGISSSLSGYTLWASDVGGFKGTPSAELYTRWMQFGAFCPVFRAHGAHSIREPWSFGPAVEKDMRELLNLRYRLSPYLYTLFREAHDTGKPIMRAMFLEFPDDAKTYDLGNQYMYGPSILVAPVTLPRQRTKSVYLPAGLWTDFWTEKVIKGPTRITVSAPLSQIPLFVREGSIIPMGPVMQYIGEKPQDPVTLHIYPGRAASSYRLYADDGSSYRYEKGEFSFWPVEYLPGKNSAIKAGPRSGAFARMAVPSYIMVIHNSDRPAGIKLNGQALEERAQQMESADVQHAGWAYDSEKRLLKISVPSATEFAIKIAG